MFLSFFMLIDLYVWIFPAITQVVMPTAEIVMPRGTPSNEGNAEIKTQPLRTEMKIRKYLK